MVSCGHLLWRRNLSLYLRTYQRSGNSLDLLRMIVLLSWNSWYDTYLKFLFNRPCFLPRGTSAWCMQACWDCQNSHECHNASTYCTELAWFWNRGTGTVGCSRHRCGCYWERNIQMTRRVGQLYRAEERRRTGHWVKLVPGMQIFTCQECSQHQSWKLQSQWNQSITAYKLARSHARSSIWRNCNGLYRQPLCHKLATCSSIRRVRPLSRSSISISNKHSCLWNQRRTSHHWSKAATPAL